VQAANVLMPHPMQQVGGMHGYMQALHPAAVQQPMAAQVPPSVPPQAVHAVQSGGAQMPQYATMPGAPCCMAAQTPQPLPTQMTQQVHVGAAPGGTAAMMAPPPAPHAGAPSSSMASHPMDGFPGGRNHKNLSIHAPERPPVASAHDIPGGGQMRLMAGCDASTAAGGAMLAPSSYVVLGNASVGTPTADAVADGLMRPQPISPMIPAAGSLPNGAACIAGGMMQCGMMQSGCSCQPACVMQQAHPSNGPPPHYGSGYHVVSPVVSPLGLVMDSNAGVFTSQDQAQAFNSMLPAR